ncbi:uncharacterized protein [Miscanthus floridulus]|uniref:uncharacterized protein n=1 Tax=Miscanthus floridulus TaxID=154761 RepID=UPI00345A53EF
MALGASASGPTSPGGGGEDASGLVIARPRAEADTPEARVLGKRTVSPVGSMGRWSRRRRSQKRQVEAPALAPRKALKVSTSSTTRWVVEAQAAIQRGAASARADPKELVTQGEATKVATKQVGEEAPTPHEAKALEPGEAEAPSITEATKGEAKASRTSEAEVVEAEAPRASKVEVADAGAPRTTEADVAEAGVPGTTEAKELEAQSLGKSMFLRWERDIWDQLQRQKNLLAHANELLSVRSVVVEDLHLRCADMTAEAAMAQEQATSLAARIKELEEELTWVAGLDKEVTRAAEASVVVQVVLEAEIQEHNGALHTGVKRALAIVSSHYAGIDLEAVSDGYVVAEDDKKAEEEVMKLVEAAEALGMALASLFKEEVVPPTSSADAGDPEF